MSQDYPLKAAGRYLPNGASAVGGAHRMAQTKSKFNNMDDMIKEDANEHERQVYVKNIEGKLATQTEENRRREEIIKKLENELLRERRLKHSDHICENCH